MQNEFRTCYVFVAIVLLAFLATNCTDKENQRIANKWKKPFLVVPQTGTSSNSKSERTGIYWNNLSNLLDSMYEIELDEKGTKPTGLYQVGGVVCGLVADEINKLPTDDVDEDAVRAGQRAYATLLTSKDFYTEWGPTKAGLRDDPGALGKNDPGRAAGAGVSVGEKQKALQLQTQIELAKAHALLVSRYKGVQFKIPHEFK